MTDAERIAFEACIRNLVYLYHAATAANSNIGKAKS